MRDYQRTQRALEESLSKPLFFIGGSVKSGTTWLQMLLDAHPQLACRGEGHLANTLLPMLQYVTEKYTKQVNRWNRVLFSEIDGFPPLENSETHHLLRTAAGLLLRQYGASPEILAIGEKTPRNALHFAELAELFPHARFIHMVRDGRDCTVSNWHQALRTRPEWISSEFGDSFLRYVDHFAPVWARYTSAAGVYVQDHPEQSFQLRYEDLLENPQAQLRPLLEFLGVDAAPHILDTCIEAASFKKVTRGRSPGQEDLSSFFRKGVAGGWAELFDDASLACFRSHGGTMLNFFGYS